MKNFIVNAFLILSISYAYGQNSKTDKPVNNQMKNPWSVLNENNRKGLYLKAFLELHNNPDYIKASTTPFERSSYYDVLVQLYNYFGEYRKAAESEEKFLEEISLINNTKRTVKLLPEKYSIDSLDMKLALEAISEIAGKQQVIMINEEHRATVHREMTLQMLPILYEKGFRYLAAETLTTNKDTLLNVRKYPSANSGYYSHDPVFGEMIRKALTIGFKVIGYDFASDLGYLKNIKSPHPMARDNVRDSIAARIIVDSILKKDPEAKILVHAGRAHAGKFKMDGVAMLAWHFREYSGINPFSIDQSKMSGFKNPADNHVLYNYFLSKYDLEHPVVFQKENGSYWSGEEEFDMYIFTPPIEYDRDYPSWLYRSGKRKPVKIKYDKLGLILENKQYTGNQHLIIQVRYQGESELAIPAQQMVIGPQENIKENFLLFKGNYDILLKNEEGKELSRYREKVK